MIRGRIAQVLLLAAGLIGLLASGDGAWAQQAWQPNAATQTGPAEDPAGPNAAPQSEPAASDSGQSGSVWSGSERATLSHALTKSTEAADRSPAKLFRWAIGNPALGEAVDGPEDLDEDEIETDRPDFTQNRKTVGRGVAQVESGLTYLRGRNSSFSDYSFPETLLRVGVVADWLELRVSQNFASDRTTEVDWPLGGKDRRPGFGGGGQAGPDGTARLAARDGNDRPHVGSQRLGRIHEPDAAARAELAVWLGHYQAAVVGREHASV